MVCLVYHGVVGLWAYASAMEYLQILLHMVWYGGMFGLLWNGWFVDVCLVWYGRVCLVWYKMVYHDVVGLWAYASNWVCPPHSIHHLPTG